MSHRRKQKLVRPDLEKVWCGLGAGVLASIITQVRSEVRFGVIANICNYLGKGLCGMEVCVLASIFTYYLSKVWGLGLGWGLSCLLTNYVDKVWCGMGAVSLLV